MTIRFLLAAAVLAVAGSAVAAEKSDAAPAGPKTASPSKLAFIDISEITEKYAKYKNAKAELEKRQEAAKKELKTLEEKIKKFEEDYKAKEAMMKDEVKRKKQEEYEKLITDYRRKGQGAMEALGQLGASAEQEIMAEIRSTVKAVAVQKNYEMVVEKQSVLYGMDDLGVRFGDDLTEDVLKILNKK